MSSNSPCCLFERWVALVTSLRYLEQDFGVEERYHELLLAQRPSRIIRKVHQIVENVSTLFVYT